MSNKTSQIIICTVHEVNFPKVFVVWRNGGFKFFMVPGLSDFFKHKNISGYLKLNQSIALKECANLEEEVIICIKKIGVRNLPFMHHDKPKLETIPVNLQYRNHKP